MGDLVRQVVDKLAADEESDLRVVAGKALGDIVKKLVSDLSTVFRFLLEIL